MEIETGIKIPPACCATKTAELRQTLQSMKVVTNETATENIESLLFPKSKQATLYSTARKLGMKVTVRQQGEDKVRFWRVK